MEPPSNRQTAYSNITVHRRFLDHHRGRHRSIVTHVVAVISNGVLSCPPSPYLLFVSSSAGSFFSETPQPSPVPLAPHHRGLHRTSQGRLNAPRTFAPISFKFAMLSERSFNLDHPFLHIRTILFDVFNDSSVTRHFFPFR